MFSSQIDGEIFQEVIKLGFVGQQLTESIKCRMQNEATVAYHLLLDHQFRDSNDYLGVEIQETTVCYIFHMYTLQGKKMSSSF